MLAIFAKKFSEMLKSKTGWKSFEKWLKQEVENEFGLKRHYEFEALDTLLNDLPTLTKEDEKTLEKLRQKLVLFVDSWSEEDLKINFIGQVLSVIDFQQPTYRAFFDCYLKTSLKGETISGKVDCVVAKGSQIPEMPLFFLQEYKPEKRHTSDPLGQLLIAMMASQALNSDNESPLYGCYIIGRYWYFVVCKGQDYIVSASFDSTTSASLIEIARIIRKIKNLYEIKLQLN